MAAAARTAHEISFPVVAIARDGTIQGFGDHASLTRATSVAITNRCFDGMVILDTSGVAHQVASAIAPSRRSIAAKLGWLFNRPANVELVLTDSAPVALAQAKSMIAKSISDHRDFWASGGSPTALKRRVNEATSIAELSAVFT